MLQAQRSMRSQVGKGSEGGASAARPLRVRGVSGVVRSHVAFPRRAARPAQALPPWTEGESFGMGGGGAHPMCVLRRRAVDRQCGSPNHNRQQRPPRPVFSPSSATPPCVSVDTKNRGADGGGAVCAQGSSSSGCHRVCRVAAADPLPCPV